MKRVCNGFVLVVAVLMVVSMVSKEVPVAEAPACSPLDLMPCLPAVTSPANPTALCCSKLRSQQQCLCDYMKDPTYGRLIDARVAKKFSTVCGIAIPKC